MIAAAHPGGFDIDDDAGIGGRGSGNLLESGTDGELIEDNGTHTADHRLAGAATAKTSTKRRGRSDWSARRARRSRSG
jgi:hypothetical protein